MPDLKQTNAAPKQQLPPNVTAKALDAAAAREAAAAQLAEMAHEFQTSGVDLRAALQGIAAIDILNQGLAGFGAQPDGHTIGDLPTQASTTPHGNKQSTVDQLTHPGSGGTDYSSPLRGMRGGFVQDGEGDGGDKNPPTPVSGTSGGEIEENRVSTHTTLSDGTVVNKSVWSTSSGDYVSVDTSDPNGEGKTVTTIVDTGGHSAVIVDNRGTDGTTQSHASGDMDVIYSEFQHRLHVGGGGFTDYDPDYEGHRDPIFHPVIDEGWRPPKKGNPNQVDPSRDPDATSPTAATPGLHFDKNILVTNPNPVDSVAKGAPNPQQILQGNPNQVDPPRPNIP